MGKKLAIKGHSTRGKEVIELLEMMGGSNIYKLSGNEWCSYYFIEGFEIELIIEEHIFGDDDICFFTLEDFLEKYPFKVGDFVSIPEYELKVRICKMRWDPTCQDVEYLVYRCDDDEWYTARELLEYNDKPSHNKPAHINKHDIVVVESYDKLHKWICEYKMYVNNRLYFFKGTYNICSNKEVNERKLIYDSFYDVDSSDTIRAASPGEITQFERMIEKNNMTNHTTNVLTELLEHIKNTSKEELEKEFKEIEEWSNVGPTVDEFMNFCNKVNKKSKYPTTYNDCCDILGFKNRNKTEQQFLNSCDLYDAELMTKLSMLKVCRDAYWKIAGDELGLGKPWKPDYTNLDIDLYVIINVHNNIGKAKYGYGFQNCVLSFPTAEMRDAFYDNFKKEIEQCKELL